MSGTSTVTADDTGAVWDLVLRATRRAFSLSCMFRARSPRRSCLAWPLGEVCGLSNDSRWRQRKCFTGGGGCAWICSGGGWMLEWLSECYELHIESIIASGRRVEGIIAGGRGGRRGGKK